MHLTSQQLRDAACNRLPEVDQHLAQCPECSERLLAWVARQAGRLGLQQQLPQTEPHPSAIVLDGLAVGKLPTTDRQAVERHVDACAACQGRVAATRALLARRDKG